MKTKEKNKVSTDLSLPKIRCDISKYQNKILHLEEAQAILNEFIGHQQKTFITLSRFWLLRGWGLS